MYESIHVLRNFYLFIYLFTIFCLIAVENVVEFHCSAVCWEVLVWFKYDREFFIPTSLLLCMLVSEAYSHVKLSLWELDHLSCTA